MPRRKRSARRQKRPDSGKTGCGHTRTRGHGGFPAGHGRANDPYSRARAPTSGKPPAFPTPFPHGPRGHPTRPRPFRRARPIPAATLHPVVFMGGSAFGKTRRARSEEQETGAIQRGPALAPRRRASGHGVNPKRTRSAGPNVAAFCSKKEPACAPMAQFGMGGSSTLALHSV